MTVRDIKCKQCIFYISWRKCSAFSDEIPDKIWSGVDDHVKPFRGDKGIRFESIEEEK
jgi:hypothetical protein